jgi:hypothetical protein
MIINYIEQFYSEGNSHPGGQDIPRILENLEFNCLLSQFNLAHMLTL